MKKLNKAIICVLAGISLVLAVSACTTEGHEHTYSEEWSKDADYHWHAATCEHSDEVSEKAEHTFVTTTKEDDKCTTVYTCSVCEYSYEETNHKWNEGEITKPATCEEDGTNTYTCTVCGKLDLKKIDSLGGHKWDEGTVTTAPTCTETGVKTYTCTVCNGTKTEDVDATGHSYSDEWSKDGDYHWHVATCEHTTEIGNKAEHSFGGYVSNKDATLTSDGTKSRTCSVCGYVETVTDEGSKLYNWFETPFDAEKFDEGTLETATSSSTYIYFGVFPKTVVKQNADGSVLYEDDGETVLTIDETTSVIMGANTYYKGSDREYYAKVTENARDTGYIYTDGTTAQKASKNGTRYFKVKPIKWRVLTKDYDIDGDSGSNTGCLLLAEDILTSTVPYFESYNTNRTINDKTVYPNNYEHSQIRAYLNGINYEGTSGQVSTWNDKGFLQTAFTASAQDLITTTTVDNSGESTSDATEKLTKADGTDSNYSTDYTCANANDKIFLLSEKEVTTTNYGFERYTSTGTGNARIRITTDYAKANLAYQNTSTGGEGYWWLRSPVYTSSGKARYVTALGDPDHSDLVFMIIMGVVPALCISF